MDEVLLRPKRRTDAGRRAFEKGDHPKSLQDFEGATAARPTDAAARFNLADGLYKNGRYDDAATLYRDLGRDPKSPLAEAARYNLGNTLFQKQDYPGAIGAYRDALRAAPDDASTRRNLELALRALKQQEEQKKQQPKDQQKDQKDKDQQQGAEGQKKPSPGQQGQKKDRPPSKEERREGALPARDRDAQGAGAAAPRRPAAQRAGGAAQGPAGQAAREEGEGLVSRSASRLPGARRERSRPAAVPRAARPSPRSRASTPMSMPAGSGWRTWCSGAFGSRARRCRPRARSQCPRSRT